MLRTVTALNDTIISEASPSSTYEARPTLTVRNVTDRILFAFLVARGIVKRDSVTASEGYLELYPTHDFPVTTFVLRRPSRDWTPSNTKWTGRPTPGATIATFTAAGVKEQPFRIPLTSELALWLSGGAPNWGVRLETTSTVAAGISFHSMNATGTKADYRPRIVMDVSAKPAPPTDISPSGGAHVSTQNPIGTWRYGGEDVAPMAAYQIEQFDSAAPAYAPPTMMNLRTASFNVNGVSGTPSPFPTRVGGIAQTIVNSGAKVIGLQELSGNVIDQPGMLLAEVKSRSHPDWMLFPIPNLNAILVDTRAATPLWPMTSNKHIGDSKWAGALLLQDVASGEKWIQATTHYLTSGFLEQQKAATRILIPWASELMVRYDAPLALNGDFNAKARAADRPMGMFATAGFLDVRDLVELEDIVNRMYNSLDGYGPNPMQGFWIDQQMVRGGIVPTLVGLRDSGDSSDHNLVYADLQYASSRVVVSGLGTPSSITDEIASQVPQHQYAAITGPTVVRIRHKSEEGRWSDFSDPVPFDFTPRPDITITSTEESTDDTSPTMTWTVTNGTQVRFRVIYRVKATGAVVADSDTITGTDNQWAPSKPVAVEPGTLLTRELRITDAVDRAATVGEPAYTSVFGTDFTIEPDNEIDPVTDLVVTNPFGPLMRLEWNRASTPDRYVITRKIGTRVRQFIVEVGQAAIGGGAYRWTDVTAPAEHNAEYWVYPEHNGKLGPATEPGVGRIVADLIWLIDPDDPTWLIPVAGSDQGTWTLGEDSTIINVVGSDRSNLIHEGFRGYEGAIDGSLHGDLAWTDGASAQEYRERVWDTKRKPTKVWRLALDDLNIPVVVRNVNVTPTPTPLRFYGLSLDFFQQGELAWTDA